MDYEKAYKEALERAKTIHNEHRAQCHDVMVKVFPELAESEDEKISREITEFLVDFNNGEYEGPNENTIDSWLSWLEKQNHDGKKWIYEDLYYKEKEQIYQDGVDDVLENPQKYGLEKQGQVRKITHEEIDTILQYLQTHGYEWDAENKQLIKK